MTELELLVRDAVQVAQPSEGSTERGRQHGRDAGHRPAENEASSHPGDHPLDAAGPGAPVVELVVSVLAPEEFERRSLVRVPPLRVDAGFSGRRLP